MIPRPPCRWLWDDDGHVVSLIDTENAPQRLRPGRIILDKSQSILSCGETWHLLVRALHAQQSRALENRR